MTPNTPGVYIDEINAFPNSVVPVATAIPAFIGYTPQALYEGKSYRNVPTKITSMQEFRSIFCFPDDTSQYSPQYYLIEQSVKPEQHEDFLYLNDTYYAVLPDPNTIYYLYNSVRLFFQNGGGDAYIVSVGSYGEPSGKPMSLGEQIVNKNVALNDLLMGLSLLKEELEPTMYLCPEATLLSKDNNASLMQAMIAQSSSMQTAISLLDVIGGNNPDLVTYMNDITSFRNNTGTAGLDYGVSYYPFLITTVMQSQDMGYKNLFGGDLKKLGSIINPASNPDEKVEKVLSAIENGELTPKEGNNTLLIISKTYQYIMEDVLKNANTLPASGGMAGVITTVDDQRGVWRAPANVSIASVANLTINLNDHQQEALNVDAMSGKSINAIRSFPGQGILVWGARTLDGNNTDWRYINARRTATFLEQSCKLALHAFVFNPNVANTWAAAKSMIESFLQDIWKQGGLQGAKAADAFSVACGLGSTMTAEDILEGKMIVNIKVAINHPAEFIVITIEQEMQSGEEK